MEDPDEGDIPMDQDQDMIDEENQSMQDVEDDEMADVRFLSNLMV